MNIYLLIAIVLILIIPRLASYPNMAIVFFIFSPLYPRVLGNVLNIQAVNDILIFFLIVCIALFGNRRFTTSAYQFQFPRKLLIPISLLFILLLSGALRIGTLPGNTFLRPIISYFFKGALIVSIYIFSYNFYKSRAKFRLLFPVIGYYYIMIGSFFFDKLKYGFSDKLQAGFIGTGNTIGNILVVSLPLLFFLTRFAKNNYPVRVLPYLSIIVILFSGSRGSMLALACMGAAFLIVKIKIGNKNKLLTIIFALLVLLYFYPSMFTDLHGQVAKIDLSEMSDESMGIQSSGRFSLWSKAYRFLSDPTHFWIGGGPNTFLQYSEHNTQNHYLKIWTDYGLIGLMIVFNLYFHIALICYRGVFSEKASIRLVSRHTLYAFLGFTVIGMFSHFEIGSKIITPFWIMVGWMLAENYLYDRDAMNE